MGVWLLFIAAALMALAGAAGVVTLRTPVHGVLSLVLNFLGLTVLYLTLSAEFMAVIQVVIYAGAIMILFLFVIALLTARKDPVERPQDTLRGQKRLAITLTALLVLFFALAGTAYQAAGESVPEGFGGVREFGKELLVTHVLPFELTAFVLLVAVIGVVILVGRGQPQRR